MPLNPTAKDIHEALMRFKSWRNEHPGKLRCEFGVFHGESCQFEDNIDSTLPLYVVPSVISKTSSTYCIFHAPLGASEISHSEILKKDVDVKYFNSLIIDRIQDLCSANPGYEPSYDLSDSPQGRRIAEYLQKTSKTSAFLDASSLNNTRILKYMQDHLGRHTLTNFKGVVFPGKFVCEDQIFLDANFDDCIFTDEVVFRNCVFRIRISFESSTFYQAAIFNNCVFEGLFIFENCKIGSDFRLEDARFADDVSLKESNFQTVHLCCPAESEKNQSLF